MIPPTDSAKANPKRRVSIEICGGLGNQLFQYAAGRAASVSLNASLELSTAFYDGAQRGEVFDRHRRKCKLDEFQISPECQFVDCQSTEVVVAPGFFRSAWNRCTGKQMKPTRDFCDTDFQTWDAIAGNDSLRLSGYWMSPKYFDGIEETLKREFRPRCAETARDATHLADSHRCSGKPLVGVHIRRGDVAYAHETLKSPESVGYRLLSMDYYREAMSHFPGSQFLIFSDDPSWVAGEFSSSEAFIAGRNSELVDFFALSYCNHQIIANSTFSWWAAWLNRNGTKTVIAPKDWYIDDFSLAVETSELLPQDWVTL